jgi:hypothetical protein
MLTIKVILFTLMLIFMLWPLWPWRKQPVLIAEEDPG